MRLAVISDIHVLGPTELARANQTYDSLGAGQHPLERRWRRGLYRVRRRLWNGHLEWRHTAFLRALDSVETYQPDWIIANGDYGGDYGGVGLSNEATYDSAALVVRQIRQRFPERARFIFGDHDLGKYSTVLRQGGIRLDSLERGEAQLGIPSFWHEMYDSVHLIGVNSSLFTLDLFLPEAIQEEVPEWERRRAEHLEQVREAFARLPRSAEVVLFCHDPSALDVLARVGVVQKRLDQVVLTVIGHLHSPTLLWLAQRMARLGGRISPRYPVARIIAKGLAGVRSWAWFKPVVCPSTFGTGHHVAGGLLLVERKADGQWVARRRPIHRRHYRLHRAGRGRA